MRSSTQAISSLLQSLPEFRGKRRLALLAMIVTGMKERRNFVIDTKSGKYLLPNLKDIISTDLFLNGYYEKGLVKLLSHSIPHNGSFIDIGANIGSITIALARLRPDIRIIAVEASPWIFNILKKNIELNNAQNVTPINYAVYNESGKVLPVYAPKELFGKGSLKAVYTNDAEMVETITIDTIRTKFNIDPVNFIKVDVEGFEAAVFKGMSATDNHEKPKIIFEYSGWTETAAGFKAGEAQTELIRKGYSLQLLDDNFKAVGLSKPVFIESNFANLLAT